MHISVIARCLLLGGMVLGAAASQANEPASQRQAGRFQLLQGEYRLVTARGEEFKRKDLLKIDSATGEVFVCTINQVDGKSRGKPGKVVQRATCEPFEREVTLDAFVDPRP